MSLENMYYDIGNMKNIKNMIWRIYSDSFIKNSIYLITTNFSGLVIGFLFWMIATRYYTPNDIGIVSAILSSILIISMISSIGLPMALTLYLPILKDGENANKIINSCLIIGIIISVIFSLIYILGVDIWTPKLKVALGDLGVDIIFVIITVMTTISSFMTGIFIAGRRSSFHMIKENIFGVMRILFIILLSGFGVVGILISWSIGMIIAMAIGFFLLYKLWRYVPSLKFDILGSDMIVKNMAKFSLGNYISGILYNVPKLIFPIVIASSISAESAGYFFIAMTIASIFYGVAEAVAGPFLAESSNKEKFWDNVDKAIKFNMMLLIPGLIGIMIFGKFILEIFNPGYASNSLTTLIILSVTSIPLSLVIIFNIVRNAQKKVISSIMTNGAIAAMTIILSVPFMRIWNIEGIAGAYLIANTVIASIVVFRIKSSKGIDSLGNGKDSVEKGRCVI